jgi:hypothetical protein
LYRQVALMGSLLGCFASAFAGEPVGAVSPAHGPVLMLYVSQPIGGRGAMPVFGLRLDQSSALAGKEFSSSIASSSPRRSLIDVQLSNVRLRHPADLRVDFGRRLTWDVRRQEFSLPNSRQSRTMQFVARAP